MALSARTKEVMKFAFGDPVLSASIATKIDTPAVLATSESILLRRLFASRLLATQFGLVIFNGANLGTYPKVKRAIYSVISDKKAADDIVTHLSS